MRHPSCVTAVLVLASAVPAFAHGGEYSAPPLYRPRPRNTVPIKGDEQGPTTGTDVPPPLVTTRGADDRGLGPDDWRYWWATQRRALLRSGGDTLETTPAGESAPIDWRVAAGAALSRALDDADDDVCTAAIVACGKVGDPAFEPRLVRILRNGSRTQTARESAALALGFLRPGAGDGPADGARMALEGTAVDGALPARLRAIAVYALGVRGDPACVETLAGLVRISRLDAQIAASAATALGLVGTAEARAELRRLLVEGREGEDDPTLVRVYAAQGLALAGDAAAVTDLRHAADDPEPAVRRAAMLALSVLAGPTDDAVQRTLRAHVDSDSEPGCRDVAVLALGRQGHRASKVVLDDALGGGRGVHLSFAATGLGLWARRNRTADATASLRRLVGGSGDPGLRGVACAALALAGDRAAAGIVLRVAEGAGDAPMRARAIAAAAELATREEAAPVLRRLLGQDQPPEVRREAASGLGVLGDVGAADTLADLLERSDLLYLRAAAVIALGRVGGPSAGARLVATLDAKEQPPILRAMAAVGLGIALDRSRDRPLHLVAAHLDWRSTTEAVAEVLSIL